MSSNPHSVALVMCHDLGLPSHLVPRVSYQIRQQLADLRSKLWMQEESDAAALHALPLARDAPEAQATMLHSLHFSSTVHPLECVAKWTPKIGGQVDNFKSMYIYIYMCVCVCILYIYIYIILLYIYIIYCIYYIYIYI
jgi:hypothetical protein